jgi:hypothetical protein
MSNISQVASYVLYHHLINLINYYISKVNYNLHHI